MPDLDKINSEDLLSTEKLKMLYIEAVKRGWWVNCDKGVIDFFAYAEKALKEDKYGTPQILFYSLIKDKENLNISNSYENTALQKLNAEQRLELINIASGNAGYEQESVEDAEEDWLKWYDNSNYVEEAIDEYAVGSDPEQLADDCKKKTIYASDGALTWKELLTNTVLLSAGEQGEKLLTEKKDSNFRKHEEESQGQLDFFKAAMIDVSYKDEISLMDINPFGIGKKPRTAPIRYDLKDAFVKVTASAEYGMATIFDYDIVIYMASHLNAQMNELKRKIIAGEKNPLLPPRKMRAYSSEMFDYLKIDQGGKQHTNLKARLCRLRGTNIEVDKKIDGGYRREGSFSLIGDWEIVSETKSGKISELMIAYPDWIYDGIVRETDPTMLTLVDDYMLLKNGMHKWLARLAKKSAGMNSWVWTLEQLYDRSGSSQPLKNFRIDLIDALKRLKEDPIPEYTFLWEEPEPTKYRRRGKGRPKKDFILTIQATGLKGRNVQSERRKSNEIKHENRASKKEQKKISL